MYNVERYLRQCLDSVLSQSLRDIQIVLVDDGSPDNCGAIADEYAQLDSRVLVVRRGNGGLGPARNTGMAASSGEYIGFVDSDDWIESQMYEHLYDAATSCNADICCGGYKAMANGKLLYAKPNPFAGDVLSDSNEIFKLRRSYYGASPSRVTDDDLPISVWPNIYKRAFLLAKNLKFKNIRSEDKFFNTYACRAATTVTAIGYTDYCYRRDDQVSIMHSFNEGTVGSYCELFHNLIYMASDEDSRYRNECLIRAKRCITDYVRVASQVIMASDSPESAKDDAIRSFLNNQDVVNAAKKYPFWKLNVPQMVFGYAVKAKAVWLVKLLARMAAAR